MVICEKVPPEQSPTYQTHAGTDSSGHDLVAAACARDPQAWQEIVYRYRGMVGKVARSYRLSDSDTADVLQNTWLRALERLDTVREPERLSGWLATTARRECLAVLRRTGREVPDGLLEAQVSGSATCPETVVIGRETRGMVARAVAQLPQRRRTLVRALFADDDVRYSDISQALDLPPGSIGPTRGRVLRSLRRSLEHVGLDAESA
jgi:RNA polymerase sigma factor (sigma-70 family)